MLFPSQIFDYNGERRMLTAEESTMLGAQPRFCAMDEDVVIIKSAKTGDKARFEYVSDMTRNLEVTGWRYWSAEYQLSLTIFND